MTNDATTVDAAAVATGAVAADGANALAAIDVGTNSFHLVVARVVGRDHFEIVTTEKEMVRLGHGGGDMKLLDVDAIERGVEALARMRKIADVHGALLRAVATSAVREAQNHDDFIRAAHERAGVDVEIISGVEEARLIHLGVLQALEVFDRRLFLCDIGGGSTELVLGYQGAELAARSVKLGAVRLTDRYFPGGRTDADSVAACRHYVRSILAPFEREVTAHGFEVAVASSGTAEAIAAVASAASGGAAPRSFNGFRLRRSALADAVERLTHARTTSARARIAGLDAGRADIIAAGGVILDEIAECFGIDEIVISDYALREGVLLDTMQRRAGSDATLHHLRDLSRRSVQRLAEQCDSDPEHSKHVARLALALFDQTAPVHGLDVGCREYLEAAAMLANVGLFVSHTKHHLHSYYVIRNSERLVGFTDHEVELIALVARYHRKSAPKSSHPEFAALGEDDQDMVRALAALLRIAIGLDRGHASRVTDVRARVLGDRIEIGLVAAPGADIGLEVYAADERRGLLETVLGRSITLSQQT